MNTESAATENKLGMNIPDFRHTGMNLTYFFITITSFWLLWMELRLCDFSEGIGYCVSTSAVNALLALLPLLPLFAGIWALFFFVKKCHSVHVQAMFLLVLYVILLISFFTLHAASLNFTSEYSWMSYLIGPFQVQGMALIGTLFFSLIYFITRRSVRNNDHSSQIPKIA